MKILKKVIGLGALTVACLSAVNAQAVAVLDFRDSHAGGIGSVIQSGPSFIGSGIGIDSLFFFNDPAPDVVYDVDGPIPCAVCDGASAASMSFDTGLGTISIVGRIPTLGITSDITLLSGTIVDGSCEPDPFAPASLDCRLVGPDSKAPALLRALGLPTSQQFHFFSFVLTLDKVGDSWRPASVDIRNTGVPEPSALLLLGSGLIGMASFIRRGRRVKSQKS